jgi:hypothetical protein
MVVMPRRNVYCKGCAFLVVAKDMQPGDVEPLCVATAKWYHGPLRPRIDVRGFVAALVRNLHNDCRYRRLVSLKGFAMAKFMLQRVEAMSLNDYALDTELRISEDRRQDDSDKEGGEEEDEEATIEEGGKEESDTGRGEESGGG